MAEDKERLVPPYIPWKTFQGYVEYLHKAKVPPRRIDTSMMPSSMSGQVRSRLKSALRFLRLIDVEGTVAEAFVTVIETYGTGSWKPALAKVVTDAYAKVVSGINLKDETAGVLNDKFREAGVDGEMRFKAVRFYLTALQQAGVEFSPHFVARGAKMLGRKPARRKSGRAAGLALTNGVAAGDDADEVDDLPPATGMTRWPIPIPGKANAIILVPENINEEDWAMIDTVVRAYIARVAKVSKGSQA